LLPHFDDLEDAEDSTFSDEGVAVCSGIAGDVGDCPNGMVGYLLMWGLGELNEEFDSVLVDDGLGLVVGA
jgi:hypothetical protein